VEHMQIGRFAHLTGLTVKALRHYDEIGLLRPAHVDPDSGYRSYAPEQVERAELVRQLRRLEVPLDDIAVLLDGDDADRQKRILVDQQRRNAERQVELKWIRQRLQALIDDKESPMTDHRTLGVDLFNRTWTLMEKDDRTPEDDDEMIHMAHASAYHWQQVGTRANRARSEWQCARVHTILGQTDQALYHARRCLELAEANEDGSMEDWDVVGAYEALARAHLVAGQADEARLWAERGRTATAAIADEDDRKVMEADFATIGI
jgi:DNA-binding transcriptional MerR regulator